MHPNELDGVIQLHTLWLRSGGKEGRRAVLEDADLRQADLRNADLSYAALAGANMVRAELAGAKLRNADLRGVDLSYADLSGADLGNANLDKSNLTGADLTQARMNDAILWWSRLDYAILSHADLAGVRAGNAVFRRADMSNARLDRADLGAADLSSANLTSASTSGITLQGARLAGALFTSDQAELLTPGQTSSREAAVLELPPDERAVSQRRLLQLVGAIQGFSILAAAMALLVCIVAALLDAYGFISTRSLVSSSGFDYLAGIAVFAMGIVLAAAATAVRLRILEGGRSASRAPSVPEFVSRIPGGGAAAQQQE